MAETLLLNRDTNDLCLDAAGNIALAGSPYSLEQDVACECKVFAGECYYDTTIGVPYPQVLGYPVPAELLKDALALAAKRVPGVTTVTVYLAEKLGRVLGGQIQFNGGIVAI